MTTNSLEKEIVARIRRNKCTQQNCKSFNTQNMEIVVFGKDQCKRKGLMCSTCFIDNQLLGELGDAEKHAISIQKFMKVLTQQYSAYAKIKMRQDWPPNLFEERRDQIKHKIIKLQKQTEKGVMEIMKFIEDSKKKAEEEAKRINHDENLQKLYELLKEDDPDQIQRINTSKQIKEITSKIQVEQGQYRISTEESIKKANQAIIIQFRQKVQKAKKAIHRLLEVHERCLKFLIE